MLGKRFRAYPTEQQKDVLRKWIGHQRFIYNAKVSEDRYYRGFSQKAVSLAGTPVPVDQEYSRFIGSETEWLREVPSQILRNGAVLWKQSYSRFFSGLARRPRVHKKDGTQSVWITSELFTFRYDPKTHTEVLYVGTKKFPVGILLFKAHTSYTKPKSLHVSVHNDKWFVSFSNEDGNSIPGEAEVLEKLRTMTEPELLARTMGFDRGVTVPVMSSSGGPVTFSAIQKIRMEKKILARKRWQRRLSRQVKGSEQREKTKRKIAKTYEYGTNVQKDVAHKASKAFASLPDKDLFVVEDLKIKDMTKKPKAKKDKNGKFLKNGAKAKAALSEKILSSYWGIFVIFLSYKALKNGKLVIKVSPHYSSQECAECGHTHKDNRVSQALFVCSRCGHTDHADRNAARVLVKRGVLAVLSGEYTLPKRKKCGLAKKNKLGQELSEVKACGEAVRRESQGLSCTVSRKQETKTARLEAQATARWA